MVNLCMKGSFYISVNFKNPKPQIVTDKFTSVLNEKHHRKRDFISSLKITVISHINTLVKATMDFFGESI